MNVWIFLVSYAVVCAAAFLYLMSKMARTVSGLMRSGMSETEIEAFRQTMFPKTILVVAWNTILFGTLISLVINGVLYMLR